MNEYTGPQMKHLGNGLTAYESKFSVEIRIAESSIPVVTVYKPQDKYGKLHGSEINWCGMGSQPVEITLHFAAALQEAAKIAQQLDQEAGI